MFVFNDCEKCFTEIVERSKVYKLTDGRRRVLSFPNGRPMICVS